MRLHGQNQPGQMGGGDSTQPGGWRVRLKFRQFFDTRSGGSAPGDGLLSYSLFFEAATGEKAPPGGDDGQWRSFSIRMAGSGLE